MDIPHVVSCSHGFLSPADLHMLLKITDGFGVAGVKISTDHAAIHFAHAMCCRTFKNMDVVFPNVHNGWSRLEEHIDHSFKSCSM